jgi:hypothetical protein
LFEKTKYSKFPHGPFFVDYFASHGLLFAQTKSSQKINIFDFPNVFKAYYFFISSQFVQSYGKKSCNSFAVFTHGVIGVVDMAGMRQWREQARRVNPSTLNPTKRYKGGPHHYIPENNYKCNGKRMSSLTILLHFPSLALLSVSLLLMVI